MNLLNNRLITVFLLIISSVQGLWLYQQYHSALEPQSRQIKASPAALPTAVDMRHPTQLDQASAFEEITRRTLFAEDRTYVEEKPAVKKKKQPKATRKPPVRDPGFELTGVYLSNHEQIALLKTRTKPKPQPVHVDEIVEGWRLSVLDSVSAILVSGDQTITVSLHKQTKNHQARREIPVLEPDPAMTGIPEDMLMPDRG